MQSEIAQIKEYSQSIGVALDLEWYPRENPPRLFLMWIDAAQAEKGAGAIILQKLQQAAKQYGFRIEFMVWEGDPGLVNYYTSLGFRLTYQGSSGEGDEPVMEYP